MSVSPRPPMGAVLRGLLAVLALVALLVPALVVATVPAGAAGVGGASSASAVAAEPSAKKKGCASKGKKFRPTTLGIKRVTKKRTVLALGRDSRNVPRSPPLSDRGKWQLAWDAKDDIKAGAKHGVIKLNAHTYPDGSALGNLLINGLYDGAKIVVRGARGQQRCYQVIARVQVPAEKRYKRYYRTDGPGRLAIAVCSGTRRGAGDWSHRTVWFAKPLR